MALSAVRTHRWGGRQASSSQGGGRRLPPCPLSRPKTTHSSAVQHGCPQGTCPILHWPPRECQPSVATRHGEHGQCYWRSAFNLYNVTFSGRCAGQSRVRQEAKGPNNRPQAGFTSNDHECCFHSDWPGTAHHTTRSTVCILPTHSHAYLLSPLTDVRLGQLRGNGLQMWLEGFPRAAPDDRSEDQEAGGRG